MLRLLFPTLFFVFIGCQSHQPIQTAQQEAIFPLGIPDTHQISKYVVHVFTDSKNRLWMGTMYKGAVCYDQSELTYYSKINSGCGNTITGFAEDATGNIWMGSHYGLYLFDGEKIHSIGEDYGIPESKETKVSKAEKNNVWITQGDKIFHLKNHHFEPIPLPILDTANRYAINPGNPVLRLVDSKGRYWFGTDGYGVFYKSDNRVVHITQNDGLCSNNITEIIEDKEGRIWISCIQNFQPEMDNNGGLCRWNEGQIIQFHDKKGLYEGDVYSLFCDSKGTVWVGASGTGIYSITDNEFRLYDHTNRMDLSYSMGIQGITEDENGNLWFGLSGGLFRLLNDEIINVDKTGPWE